MCFYGTAIVYYEDPVLRFIATVNFFVVLIYPIIVFF